MKFRVGDIVRHKTSSVYLGKFIVGEIFDWGMCRIDGVKEHWIICNMSQIELYYDYKKLIKKNLLRIKK